MMIIEINHQSSIINHSQTNQFESSWLWMRGASLPQCRSTCRSGCTNERKERTNDRMKGTNERPTDRSMVKFQLICMNSEFIQRQLLLPCLLSLSFQHPSLIFLSFPLWVLLLSLLLLRFQLQLHSHSLSKFHKYQKE